MPSVPIYLKDEPIIKNGTNTEKGLAYTICESNKPTIFIKKVFYQTKNQKQIDNVIKHELVHAYFCRQGVQVGHNKLWRDKFRSIGGFGN
jgi:predicted SprT family Zn-dependent metalloprotease